MTRANLAYKLLCVLLLAVCVGGGTICFAEEKSVPAPSRYYQVAMDISIKGRFITTDRKVLGQLVLSALQQVGSSDARVGFVDVTTSKSKGTIRDIEYSGDYNTTGGLTPGRGNFQPPTDRLDLVVVAERTLKRNYRRIHIDRFEGKLKHWDETVYLQLAGKVVDINTNVVRYGVGPVEITKKGQLNDTIEASNSKLADLFGGWLGTLFPFKIRREQVGGTDTTFETPKPLILTFEAVTEAARQIVAGLETAGPSDSTTAVAAPKGPVFMGLDQSRRVVTLGGNLKGLEQGDRLIIPLRRTRGETALGEEENVTAKVTDVGRSRVQATFIDPLTGEATRLGTQYAVDIRRPIEKL